MAELLNGLEDFVVPYLDDIAIFSDTWESHPKYVETVLQRIKKAKLTIKPSKCKFAQQNVKFLCHIVGQGFRTNSEVKVQAVLEYPTPRTKTQIRVFLGLAGYYQKYINLFSVIVAPLTDALKGKAKREEITWTTECENTFRELKGKLIDKPVLYAPNFEREFIFCSNRHFKRSTVYDIEWRCVSKDKVKKSKYIDVLTFVYRPTASKYEVPYQKTVLPSHHN
ncbi:retrovirus-related Pol polyprotein from transposon 297 [Trichonephila clavipes]|nr:retrovirus-related Pol polyprotein from transposon 297 [Trichonephila clavipes]